MPQDKGQGQGEKILIGQVPGSVKFKELATVREWCTPTHSREKKKKKKKKPR